MVSNDAVLRNCRKRLDRRPKTFRSLNKIFEKQNLLTEKKSSKCSSEHVEKIFDNLDESVSHEGQIFVLNVKGKQEKKVFSKTKLLFHRMPRWGQRMQFCQPTEKFQSKYRKGFAH